MRKSKKPVKSKSSGGGRDLTVRVKSAKGRKSSSMRWLKRQLNDPYVTAANRAGFRSRAAFKLEELDDQFSFLKPSMRIVELGAAPGGWTQVIVKRVATGKVGSTGKVIAIDILAMDPIPDAQVMQLDFLDDGTSQIIIDALGGPAHGAEPIRAYQNRSSPHYGAGRNGLCICRRDSGAWRVFCLKSLSGRHRADAPG
jgi:23S rRNA (uridine2552-2'-O)-methyltransferase